jgi:hypothetical protein
MSAEETEIYEFLKKRDASYVSVGEISKALGRGRKFQKDRNWARPILRRMEMDGVLEENSYGEYRIKGAGIQPNEFKEALRNPGARLGDTTIIRIQDT